MTYRTRLLLCALLLIPMALAGCVTPSSSPPAATTSQDGPSPDQVATLVYQSALLGVATGKAAVVSQGDGPACLALSIADGALRTGYQVFTSTTREMASSDGLFQPPEMVVDAGVCVALGIPSLDAPPEREAELRAAAAMGAAGSRAVAVMLCSSLGKTSPECLGASWSVAVVDAGLEGWSAVVSALADEAAHPDGIVVVSLPELAYPRLTAEEPASEAQIVAAAADAPVLRWARAAGSIRQASSP